MRRFCSALEERLDCLSSGLGRSCASDQKGARIHPLSGKRSGNRAQKPFLMGKMWPLICGATEPAVECTFQSGGNPPPCRRPTAINASRRADEFFWLLVTQGGSGSLPTFARRGTAAGLLCTTRTAMPRMACRGVTRSLWWIRRTR